MAKKLVGLVALMTVAVAAVVFLPSVSHAQGSCEIDPRYQGTATFGANVTAINAGGTIIFEGTGWPPNSTLELFVNDEPIGSVVTDANGAWTFQYVVPANASGTQTATVACGSFVLSTQFTVTAGTAPAPSAGPGAGATTLPVTGSDSLSWVQIGIALVALGAVLLYLSKRRNRQLVA